MSTESVMDLIGEGGGELGLGEDMNGPDLYAGYIPDHSILHMPQAQIGDGLAGPPNEQHLQIFRDNRVIATDELGMQGPFTWEKLARHRAGRTFPLNYEWDTALARPLTGMVPEQDARYPSPIDPSEYELKDGFTPTEVLPNPSTVFYTASPDVGWPGY